MRTKAAFLCLVNSLIKALRDDDYPNVRGRAADSLGKLGDPQAVEPLMAALQDENSYVRWLAAGALGVLGDPRAVGPLKELLPNEKDPVLTTARRAIEKIRGGGQ